MSIPIKLLNHIYQIQCPEGKEQELIATSQFLSQKMEEIRDQGRVLGFERITIMAALNIAYELLCHQNKHTTDLNTIKCQIERLQKKMDTALMEELEPMNSSK